MWLPEFACPECGDELASAFCVGCGRRYVERDGIWRFLGAARQATLDPFLRRYRLVRAREGRHRTDAEYYRALPAVEGSDRQATEWRIRRETYGNLLRRLFAAAPQGVRVLDLGAGCAWLSHRLSELGHRVVAVDVLDDEADGLGAAAHYGVRFPVVQADFDRLPFAPAQFDVVVFNGSLHYAADAATTLRGAHRMLTPGGAVVVMDSPMFEEDRDGRLMADDAARRIEAQLGEDARHGVGYLTFAGLNAAAAALELGTAFVPSHGPFAWRMRRRLAKFHLRRAPAAFGLWVAR